VDTEHAARRGILYRPIGTSRFQRWQVIVL